MKVIKDSIDRCRITNKGLLGRQFEEYYDRIQRKYPLVILVTGEVGTGKSRSIMLNLLDYWYKHFHEILPPEKYLTADLLNYSVALKSAPPLNMVVLDEAIDAFGKGSSNRKIVHAFKNMFGICRERQVATVIVLDDLFVVTSSLCKYITLWVHCDCRIDNKCNGCGKKFAGEKACPHCGSTSWKEGVVKYRVYSKERLRKIIRENESRTAKSIYIKSVKPNWRSYINEYRGVLEEPYKRIKDSKTEETMDDLIKTVKIGKRELKKATEEFLKDERREKSRKK